LNDGFHEALKNLPPITRRTDEDEGFGHGKTGLGVREKRRSYRKEVKHREKDKSPDKDESQ
jgi:hypothetical protein